MQRRKFLSSSAGLIAGSILIPQLITGCRKKGTGTTEKLTSEAIEYPGISVGTGEVTSLRGNVSYFNNAGGTVGIVETKDGFTIIDTQSVKGIRPLLNGISKVEGKEVQYVCNTHHHGDHTGGNASWDENQCIIAQRKCPEYQKLRAQEQGNESEQRYANTLFDTEFTVDAGEETIKCYHFGNGHTSNDVMYHVENANVVHMGDLMFNDIVPVFRVKDGADAHGWIARLDKAIEMFDDDTQFIFGHGVDAAASSGNKENLKRMRGFLADTTAWMEQQIKDGNKLDDLKKAHKAFPGHEDRITFWDAHFNECLTGFYENLSTS